jgi:hypothetical protein
VDTSSASPDRRIEMLTLSDRRGEAHAIEALTLRLVREYSDRYPADRVEAVVDAECRRFAEARIRIYVPLLAERNAREALGRRCGRA